jgi:tetratricopeptide (TPR) repeat protein
MKRLEMILVVMATAVSLSMCVRAESAADVPGTDKLAAAKSEEHKADLARMHNDYSSAIFYYQKAVRIDPQNSNLYNKLAVSEFKLGNKSSARRHFQLAVKYDPRNGVAFNNLGALSLVEKKYNPAVRYLKQALALDELNATAHLNLAEAWMGLDDVDRAMTEYSRALELDADILSAGQNGVVAQVTTPEERARVSYMIARAYAKRGNLEGALEYLRRAKEGGFPKMAGVYNDQEFAALWQDPRLATIVKRNN